MALRSRVSYDCAPNPPAASAGRPASACPIPEGAEEPVPTIRPFRALRYDPEVVGDVAAVVSPPYDLIGPTAHDALLARHPRNIVRLDLPLEEPGEEPDERYRRAARTYAAWRADGVLHRDRRPSLYAYEQSYRMPGGEVGRIRRGFFGRLRLEPFGPESTVRPLEGTLPGPSEDRYRLLRASGANFSPVVGLYDDRDGATRTLLAEVAERPPDLEVGDEGTRHRLWMIPEIGHDPTSDGTVDRDAGVVAALAASAGAGPITIADGHHRYGAALRYRDERRGHVLDGDEPFDYVLALLLADDQPVAMLPIHRVVCGIGREAIDALEAGLPGLFSVRPVERIELLRRFGPEAADGDHAGVPDGTAGRGRSGRLGFWGPGGGLLLEARHEAIAPLLPPAGPAMRALDATLLQVVLDRLAGPAVPDGGTGRLAYAASAAEALARVDSRVEDAAAAFMLEAAPIADILAVARDGDLLPPKSGSLHPAVPSGLVVNPHEW